MDQSQLDLVIGKKMAAASIFNFWRVTYVYKQTSTFSASADLQQANHHGHVDFPPYNRCGISDW